MRSGIGVTPFAGCESLGHVLPHEEDAALVERALDGLPFARRGALVQSSEYGDRAEHPAHHIDDRRAGAQRPVTPARHVGKPAHHLHHFIEAGAMLVRAREKSLERAVNQLRVHLPEGVVAEAQPVHRAGAEVLRQRVSTRDELQHRLPAPGRFQVDGHALLVPVVGREETGARRNELAGVIALQRLDLDHLGAHVGKDQAAGRPHDDVTELDDLDPFQRQWLAHQLFLNYVVLVADR
jgi:hypothetical protein